MRPISPMRPCFLGSLVPLDKWLPLECLAFLSLLDGRNDYTNALSLNRRLTRLPVVIGNRVLSIDPSELGPTNPSDHHPLLRAARSDDNQQTLNKPLSHRDLSTQPATGRRKEGRTSLLEHHFASLHPILINGFKRCGPAARP